MAQKTVTLQGLAVLSAGRDSSVLREAGNSGAEGLTMWVTDRSLSQGPILPLRVTSLM